MKRIFLGTLALALLISGCRAAPSIKAETNGAEAQMQREKMDFSDEKNTIYLAGGCFWGLEMLMQSIPGVIDAESGYANGTGKSDAKYSIITGGRTGFRETVKVTYDPDEVSLDALLLAYFYVIDPTVANRQGNDVGSQYQTGVYYTNDEAKKTVERIAAIERGRSKRFEVEIGPLVNYYPAEEYHQNYLEKNPHTAGRDRAFLKAQDRPRRLRQARGGGHTG